MWTLSQPGGTYYAHHITTGTPRFSDLATALYRIYNLNTKSIYVLYFVYKVWRLHSWRHKTVVLNFLAAVCLLASPYDSIPLTHFLQVYVYLASHSLYIRVRPETTFLRVGDGRVYLKKYCSTRAHACNKSGEGRTSPILRQCRLWMAPYGVQHTT